MGSTSSTSPTRFVYFAPGLAALVTLVLASCNNYGSCGGAAGSSDVCPPPVYGYGAVEGRALQSDGSPLARKQVYVSCGPVAGALDDSTDSQGRYHVLFGYGVFDTLLYPFPPRNTDGSFELSCDASLRLPGDVVLRANGFGVRFMPTRDAVVPTVVDLREEAP